MSDYVFVRSADPNEIGVECTLEQGAKWMTNLSGAVIFRPSQPSKAPRKPAKPRKPKWEDSLPLSNTPAPGGEVPGTKQTVGLTSALTNASGQPDLMPQPEAIETSSQHALDAIGLCGSKSNAARVLRQAAAFGHAEAIERLDRWRTKKLNERLVEFLASSSPLARLRRILSPSFCKEVV